MLTARPGVRLLVRKVLLIRVSSLLQACCKDYGNNVGEAVGVSSERPLSTSHRVIVHSSLSPVAPLKTAHLAASPQALHAEHHLQFRWSSG